METWRELMLVDTFIYLSLITQLFHTYRKTVRMTSDLWPPLILL